MHRMPLLFLALAACSAAGSPSGTVIPAGGGGNTRTFTAGGFDSVELAAPATASVTIAPDAAISAQGDPAALDQLELRQDGTTLRIGVKPGINWNSGRVALVIALPRLTSASVTGSGSMTVGKLSGDRFAAAITGSGELALTDLTVGEASLVDSGSGKIVAGGSARTLTASSTGSGGIAAAGLSSTSATVSVTGSGDVAAKVAGPATVSITGTGDVTLTGGARCTISQVGSGKATCS